jgi:hypothetical protein
MVQNVPQFADDKSRAKPLLSTQRGVGNDDSH